jgi:molybdopterin biosynthesis enzyme
MLASLGIGEVTVFLKPAWRTSRPATSSDQSALPAAGEIYDSNRHALRDALRAALTRRHGDPRRTEAVEPLRERRRMCGCGHHVGRWSVGEGISSTLLDKLGEVLWKIAMKPGRLLRTARSATRISSDCRATR